mmetsp:Transcript_30424/g.85995  ORF Transcript_30424/g.85995 Transcript_30424/m.85995 type:complete len:338 (-) Transcript_30424:463-1476(-)
MLPSSNMNNLGTVEGANGSGFVSILGVSSPQLAMGVATPDVNYAVSRKGKDMVVPVGHLHKVGPLRQDLELGGHQRGAELIEVVTELPIVVWAPRHEARLLLLYKQRRCVVLPTVDLAEGEGLLQVKQAVWRGGTGGKSPKAKLPKGVPAPSEHLPRSCDSKRVALILIGKTARGYGCDVCGGSAGNQLGAELIGGGVRQAQLAMGVAPPPKQLAIAVDTQHVRVAGCQLPVLHPARRWHYVGAAAALHIAQAQLPIIAAAPHECPAGVEERCRYGRPRFNPSHLEGFYAVGVAHIFSAALDLHPQLPAVVGAPREELPILCDRQGVPCPRRHPGDL